MCSSHALGRHLLCLQSKSQCSSGLILISGRVNGARTLHVQRTHSDSCSKVSRRCRCRTRRCCSQPRHCQYTTAVSFSSLVSCHRGKEQLRWRHARGSSMRDLVLPPPKKGACLEALDDRVQASKDGRGVEGWSVGVAELEFRQPLPDGAPLFFCTLFW